MVTSKSIMRRANVRFNYHDYCQLPEDKRYEILDGELYVVPAPGTKHQRVSKRLQTALILQVERKGLGEIFNAPYDVLLSEEDIVQPDILFVRKDRQVIIGDLNIRGAPDLVIEILSPGTRTRDLEIKEKIYAGFGVQEYWIVDPEVESIEVLTWREAGYVRAGIHGSGQSLSSPLLPELILKLDEVFV